MFLTLSAQSVLKFIFLNDGPAYLFLVALVLLNSIFAHYHMLHHRFLSFITPIDLVEALLIRMDVLHMSGVVQARHFLSATA